MNVPLTVDKVPCQGISWLSLADIEQAKAAGKRWKLIGRISREDGRFSAAVGPELVPLTDPLAHVTGATNAITYDCDLAGPITLIGPGAGRTETGFSILVDLINIQRDNI